MDGLVFLVEIKGLFFTKKPFKTLIKHIHPIFFSCIFVATNSYNLAEL